MNPLVGCFAVVGVVCVIGIVGVAIFFGIAALGGMKSTLRMAGYQTQANGSRRSEKNEGDRNVVAVENRSTKSAFLMVSRDFPPGMHPDVDGYLETLRLNGNVNSSSPTQRAGLNGVRYEFVGRSMTSPTHIGEFYVIGNKAVIVMYMPGNALQQLQGKSSRYTSEKQREIDDPDGFFSSFESAQN
jgi:formylmethanofuran dehydrogenase subunit B